MGAFNNLNFLKIYFSTQTRATNLKCCLLFLGRRWSTELLKSTQAPTYQQMVIPDMLTRVMCGTYLSLKQQILHMEGREDSKTVFLKSLQISLLQTNHVSPVGVPESLAKIPIVAFSWFPLFVVVVLMSKEALGALKEGS